MGGFALPRKATNLVVQMLSVIKLAMHHLSTANIGLHQSATINVIYDNDNNNSILLETSPAREKFSPARGGIRTHNLNRRAAADLLLLLASNIDGVSSRAVQAQLHATMTMTSTE